MHLVASYRRRRGFSFRFIASQVWAAVCDRPAFVIFACAPSIAPIAEYCAASDLYRSEIAGPLLREGASIATMAAALFVCAAVYLIAGEQAKKTEEMDLSMGITAWRRHCAATAVCGVVAIMLVVVTAASTTLAGLLVDDHFVARDYAAWSTRLTSVIPAGLTLVQVIGITWRFWRQPVGAALVAVGISVAAWNTDVLVDVLRSVPGGSLAVSALVPDVNWILNIVLASAYGGQQLGWSVWAWCFVGVLVQAVLLFAGCLVTPLSSDYAERRCRVVTAG